MTSEQKKTAEELKLSESRARRSRAFFLGAIAAFVIFCSFFYGLSRGFSRAQAVSMLAADTAPPSAAAFLASQDLNLAPGISILPLGQNGAINGKPADVISFVTDRSVHDVLSDQVYIWERQGMLTFGAGSAERGSALAHDTKTGEKYAITAWIIPPTLRRTVAQGKRVQGFVSRLKEERFVTAPGEEEGRVPGIPLFREGKSGAVYRTSDAGGESWSALYKNPGSLEENLDFYRRELRGRGWHEQPGSMGLLLKEQTASLMFEQAMEEIVLLFSPASRNLDEKQTVILAIRGPKAQGQTRR